MTPMIDETNRDIIMALMKNGRESYTQLAKTLHLLPMTVANRVEAMVRDDIFAIRAVPNPIRMGYNVMAVVGLDVELSQMDNVCDQLADFPNISYIAIMFGKFDVILFVEYRDFNTLYKLVREQMPKIKGIKSIETFIIADCKKGYMKAFQKTVSSRKPYSIDDLDEKLINELRIDGRASFSDLSNKFGISSATVSRRVSALVENDVIQITVVANPTKLGRHVVGFLGIQAELTKIEEICACLADYAQIPLVMTLMNGYNILAVVAHTNLTMLLKFITNEMAHIDGVLNIETLIRGEFKKRTYLGFDLQNMLFNPLDDSKSDIALT